MKQVFFLVNSETLDNMLEIMEEDDAIHTYFSSSESFLKLSKKWLVENDQIIESATYVNEGLLISIPELEVDEAKLIVSEFGDIDPEELRIVSLFDI
jgi:hypothetical protein